MHNIEASGQLLIAGFVKTVADMRRFVALADEFALPDSTLCNGVVTCRVDAVDMWTHDARDGKAAVLLLPAGEA